MACLIFWMEMPIALSEVFEPVSNRTRKAQISGVGKRLAVLAEREPLARHQAYEVFCDLVPIAFPWRHNSP